MKLGTLIYTLQRIADEFGTDLEVTSELNDEDNPLNRVTVCDKLGLDVKNYNGKAYSVHLD